MSGAVAVHYRGPKNIVAIGLEYWKGGVKTGTSNGLSMTLMDQEKDKQGNYIFDGHIVYSLQDRSDPNRSGIAYRELVYAIVSPNGYVSSTFKVDIPEGIKMWSGIQLPQETKVPLDESTTVWGVQGTDQQQMSSYSSPTETLQRADWAMSVRLGFNDSDHTAAK
ncbi:hypothetical protein LJK88_45400 [Paenibacillus sp. P26]|nr:hypothetical protein LJK88_45400 [Paenibacillus sp. P26]